MTSTVALAVALSLTLLARSAGAASDVDLVPASHGGIPPVAQVDAEGNIHMVSFRGDPSQGDLYHAILPLGASEFGDAVRVNATDGSAIATGTIRGASLALGRPATPVWSKPAAVFDGERFVIMH